MFQQIFQEAFSKTAPNKNGERSISDLVYNLYDISIRKNHEKYHNAWPVINGHNVKTGDYKDFFVVIFEHTGNPSFKTSIGIGSLSNQFDFDDINKKNINSLRRQVIDFYRLSDHDCIFIVRKDLSNLESELSENLMRSYKVMNLLPMKIFLSHKSIDKPKVRDFKKTLQLLGFDPWLDEDNMHAGVELERALLQGIKDSCAVVFFITPDYVDQNYLASEIDYVRQQKRANPNFQIISLVFEENGKKGVIPDLLTPYVWKEPKTDLDALQEIIKALPIKVGGIEFR